MVRKPVWPNLNTHFYSVVFDLFCIFRENAHEQQLIQAKILYQCPSRNILDFVYDGSHFSTGVIFLRVRHVKNRPLWHFFYTWDTFFYGQGSFLYDEKWPLGRFSTGVVIRRYTGLWLPVYSIYHQCIFIPWVLSLLGLISIAAGFQPACDFRYIALTINIFITQVLSLLGLISIAAGFQPACDFRYGSSYGFYDFIGGTVFVTRFILYVLFVVSIEEKWCFKFVPWLIAVRIAFFQTFSEFLSWLDFSGHLVPSHLGLAYVLLVKTNPFPEFVIIFPDYALLISIGTLSIFLVIIV